MRAQRRIAHATTNRPPLKRMIKPIFFTGFKLDCQSMGTGMEIRYRSVMTFMERYTQMTSFDTAG